METTHGAVVRVGGSATAVSGHALEARSLPALRDWLPVAVPDPRWHILLTASLPFGAIGYPKLAGRTLAPTDVLPGSASQRLACQVGAFLAALHSVPLEEAWVLGVPEARMDEAALAAWRDMVLPVLWGELTREEYATVARWWEHILADPRMRRYTTVLRHGDLWYENLLVDEPGERLVGVLDFEEASLGDPAQDLATQLHLGEPFAAAVLAAYRASGGTHDAEITYRMRRLFELRVFDSIRFAVEEADMRELADGIAKLHVGPILAQM